MNPVEIDLSQDTEENTEDLKVTPGEKSADEAVESGYPHFHYKSDIPLDIPKRGVMQVEYEVVFEEQEEGTTVYKVDLHRITGVEDVEAAPEEDLTEPAVGALDRLAGIKTKENLKNVPR